MSAPRQRISESLAERGRPAMWANEQEAAVLSGYSPEAFREKVVELEVIGFPKKSRLNGLRFIPAILNFWAVQVDSSLLSRPESVDKDERDGPEVENFGNVKRTQRRSA